MTQPTPPPDQPLPDQTRARIRAELMAAAQARPAAAGRWSVLVATAASVVVVTGLTVWAVGLGEGTGRSDPHGLATSASSPATDKATPSADSQSLEPTEPASSTPTPSEPPTVACATELQHVLKGADPVLEFPEAGGTTSFWVRGQQFSLCAARADTVTVHKPLSLEPDFHDVATFRVSSIHRPTEDGYRTIRVAGGIVPEGALAFDVAYTFPDGHTETATKATDEQDRTWWRMVYAYDDAGNEMEKAPIEVSVSLSGSRFEFTLDWGLDTCAQANHGC